MMSAVFHRSAFEPGGIIYEWNNGCDPLPPHVHHVYTDIYGKRHEVTFQQVRKERRERHERRVAHVRGEEAPGPERCYVWTFFNRQDIPYYGWYCYVITRRNQSRSVNFREFDDELARELMMAFPLNFLPHPDNFYLWMEAFAKAYPKPRGRRDKRRAGVRFGWMVDGHFTDKQPELKPLPLP